MSAQIPNGWDFISEGRTIKIDYENRQILAGGMDVFEDAVHVHSGEFDPELFFTVINGEIIFKNDDAGELFAFYNGDCVYSAKDGNITFFSPYEGEYKAYAQHVGSIELIVDNMSKMIVVGKSGILKPETKFIYEQDGESNTYGASPINFYDDVIEIPISHKHSSGIIMAKIDGDTLDYSSVVVMGKEKVERIRKLFTIVRQQHCAYVTIEDLPESGWMSGIQGEFDLMHNPNNFHEEIWRVLGITPLYQGKYVSVSADKEVFFKFENTWVLMDKRQVEHDKGLPNANLYEYNLYKSIKST